MKTLIHALFTFLITSTAFICIGAFESATGAGYIHWLGLVLSIIGISSQFTLLLSQVSKEINNEM